MPSRIWLDPSRPIEGSLSTYELFKFLHVATAIAWVGGGIALLSLRFKMKSAGEQEAVMAMGRQAEAFGKQYFMPMSIGTLVFGVISVLLNDAFSFADAWISIGFVGIIASSVIGAVLISRTGREIEGVLAEAGPGDPRIVQLDRKMTNLEVIDLVILLVTVWAMVAKPGL